jgi:glycosyltransferase involved in cell wall biosynthesis
LQLPEHPHFLRTLPLNLLRDLRCFKQLGELPLCARLLELLSSKQSSQLAHGEASASASATSYRRIYALLAHLCYRIVTVNYELREFLEQSLDIPPQRVAVIPNGVDPLLFHGKYDVSSLRTQLKIPTDLPWIASIGRLEPEKGHRYLLEAVAQLERPVHLLLVGQGSQLDALRDLAHRLGISARTHFLGMRRDIPQILSAIDILALPSLREGLPLVLLEAMASHVPFVASAVGGIPALCAQSQAGITTQSQQTTSIAQALHALLTQPMLRQQMGERGRWWVERHYNQKQMTSHYADLYSSAIQSHNRTLPPVVASLLMQIFAHKSRISTV